MTHLQTENAFVLEHKDTCLQLLGKVTEISPNFFIAMYPLMKEIILTNKDTWRLEEQTHDEYRTLFIGLEKKADIHFDKEFLLSLEHAQLDWQKETLFQVMFNFIDLPDGIADDMPGGWEFINFRADDVCCEGDWFQECDNETDMWYFNCRKKISEIYSYKPGAVMSHQEGLDLLKHMVSVSRANPLLHYCEKTRY